MIYVPKEFKTFLIKLDTKLLDNLKPQKFDFSLLDYVDISSKVRKHSKNPLYPFLLGFSFNNLKEIPKEILDIIGVKEEWL